jgi:hypothetical protein
MVYYLFYVTATIERSNPNIVLKNQTSNVSYLRHGGDLPCLAFNNIWYVSLIAIVNE